MWLAPSSATTCAVPAGIPTSRASCCTRTATTTTGASRTFGWTGRTRRPRPPGPLGLTQAGSHPMGGGGVGTKLLIADDTAPEGGVRYAVLRSTDPAHRLLR